MEKDEKKEVTKTFDKDLFIKSIYSKENMVENLLDIRKSMGRSKIINRNTLKKALMEPTSPQNAKVLQDALYIYRNTNGILKQFINYQSNILTNDFFIVPLDMSKFKSKDDMWKKELETAKYVEMLNIKNNFKWIAEEVLTFGELYLYIKESKTSIIPLRIPPELCVILGKDEDFNSRFGIDLTKIKEKDLNYYPEEIQDAWMRKKTGSISPDEIVENKYYKVSSNGVVITLDEWGIKGVPNFSYILEDLSKFDEMKDVEMANAILNNFKVIHQLIPTDDKGEYLIEFDEAMLYHEALKGTVPKGIGTLTSPMKLDSITLGDTASKNMDYLTKIKKDIYDTSGFNDDLFNGNKSSNEAIVQGTVLDTLLPLKLQDVVARILNSRLKKNSKTKNWKICFLDSTRFNKNKYIQQERENLAIYGSKKKYLASQGFTPLEAMNIIKNEELLDIASSMLPMQTSHTMSKGDGGRPSNEVNPNSNTNTGESQNG